MGKSANLPAPYKGVNEKVPVAALQSPYCENLFNFNVTPAGISLRKGDSKYAKSTKPSTSTVVRLVSYGSSKLFYVYVDAALKLNLYDVDAGALVCTSAANSLFRVYDVYFNKYLFFFTPDVGTIGHYYNGSTYGVIGYTGVNLKVVGGNTYNERGYFIQSDEAAYWYTDLLAITGALTKVDLSGIIEESATLMVIAKVTIADNVSAITLQAFVFSTGEVIFYTGSYPNGSDWGRVGSGRIGQPIDYGCYIKYQGDALVLCDSGVVSLRDLFLKGSETAALLNISAEAQNTWQTLIKAFRVVTPTGPLGLYIHAFSDDINNRIVIPFPSYIDAAGATQIGTFYFIYNTLLQSWYYHRSYGPGPSSDMQDVAKYKNQIFMVSSTSTDVMVYKKEGATGYTDRNVADTGEVSYNYQMVSAPIPFPKTAVYDADAIEPIMESDLYTQTNWTLISDFGKQTTENQNITDMMLPTVSKPLVNTGIKNITFVQVAMNGTTVTGRVVGLNLYSFNVWYDNGEEGSR